MIISFVIVSKFVLFLQLSVTLYWSIIRISALDLVSILLSAALYYAHYDYNDNYESDESSAPNGHTKVNHAILANDKFLPPAVLGACHEVIEGKLHCRIWGSWQCQQNHFWADVNLIGGSGS